jgi:signal transduction histidine kinase
MTHLDDTAQLASRGPGWLRGAGWRQDLVLPAALLVVQMAAAAITLAGPRGPSAGLGAADWALLAAGPAALAFRRRYPVAVLWITLLVTLPPSGVWPANLSLIAAFLFAATGGHRRAAWVVIVAGYLCTVWLIPLASGHRVASLTFALALLGWLAVLVVAAELVRSRRERTAQARAARQVDQQRQASEERLQMARELHDVVGHTMSLINVQAGVGLDLMDSRPEQARVALTAIKAASREALDELRTMLAALRQSGEDVPLAPSSGLDRLPELVGLTRAAGLSVSTEVAGDRRPLPAATDLAAYRIIQESLTNVARHAGPARVVIRLSYKAHSLEIMVRDNGRVPGGRGGSSPGTGSGIAGMQQRALALGGQLDAHPRPEGGFIVTACLPLVNGRDARTTGGNS